MKRSSIFLLLAISTLPLIAQRETFEQGSYAPPKGWQQEVKKNTYTSYTYINKKTKAYCRLYIMLSIETKGSIDKDFANEWQTLVLNQYKIADTAQVTDPITENGWLIKKGKAHFTFNNVKSTAMLTTWSGHNRTFSILALTNSNEYFSSIQIFLESLELKSPTDSNVGIQPAIVSGNAATLNTKFAFTTTNSNDGWQATEQPDWVKVSKGNTIVLIHYTQPDIRSFNNLDESTAFVWNTLVAPRYSNASNLWMRRSFWADGDFMNGKYFGEADLTENATGKRVHVVIYKNGNSGKWIEFITADKTAFQNEFSIVYPEDGTQWDKLSAMVNYNKFAVSANDLSGNWKSSSGAGIEYYNVYTGNSMGMASASSTTEFIFQPGGTYTSIYKGVDGFNGSNRYVGETYKGKCVVSNWEMTLTNRFKGTTENFSIQFEAVKGGRILHMYRGSIEELHLFKMK